MDARTIFGTVFLVVVVFVVLAFTTHASRPVIVSSSRISLAQGNPKASASESPDSALSVAREFEEAAAPAAPVWPPRFQQDFSEDTYFVFFTLTTAGRFYYDYAEKRTRVDRENGVGDRYCGSAMAGYNTPCSHIVFEGMRYLVFPKEKYCCKCCSDEQGCGVVRPDWLANATYLGHDYIFGILTTKWNQPGLQNNYYWQAFDDVPVRLNMEYVSQMTFNHSSFSKPAKFDDNLFELPPSLE